MKFSPLLRDRDDELFGFTIDEGTAVWTRAQGSRASIEDFAMPGDVWVGSTGVTYILERDRTWSRATQMPEKVRRHLADRLNGKAFLSFIRKYRP